MDAQSIAAEAVPCDSQNSGGTFDPASSASSSTSQPAAADLSAFATDIVRVISSGRGPACSPDWVYDRA